MHQLAKVAVAVNNVPVAPTFAHHHQTPASSDDCVTPTHNTVRWLYPWSAMRPGDQVFVADHGGLASAAQRALLTRRQWVTRNAAPDRYSAFWRVLDGIRGIVIRRAA